jgi:formylglycine-generating enzyme required for sulfatase activity
LCEFLFQKFFLKKYLKEFSMKKLSLLFAGLALFALTTCNNPYIQTLLKAPSELVSLGVTAYVGDYPLTGGASFEPGFTPSVREYVVYVPKEATGFTVDAQFRGNGTVTCMSEAQDNTRGPESMEFIFAEEETEKNIVLLVTRENMDTGEYRLTVIRDDGVDAPKGIQVRITPSIGTYFLGRGIVPELEVAAAIPENEAIEQTYQWYKNDDNNNRTGRQIAGATGAKYRLTATEAAYEGTVYFYCAVTNSLNGRTTVVESGTKGVTFVVKEKLLGEKSLSMTDIPAGTVDGDEWKYSDPISWNTPGFKLGTYEVTYELWKTVFNAAEAGSYSFANIGNQGGDINILQVPSPVGNKLHPVTSISWNDCAVWCNAYSEMDGRQPVYIDSDMNVLRDSRESVSLMIDTAMMAGRNGYRLPTCMEWEYAARGADLSDAVWNYTYIGTDNYSESSDYYWLFQLTKEVGAVEGIKPNSLGLYDMGGNVMEVVEFISNKGIPFMGSGYFDDDTASIIRSNFCRYSSSAHSSSVLLGGYYNRTHVFGFRLALDKD